MYDHELKISFFLQLENINFFATFCRNFCQEFFCITAYWSKEVKKFFN